jgi:signal transduction histidine kinase
MNIQDHPFFNGFRPDDAAKLIAVAEAQEVSAKAIIFSEGDPSDSVCLVLKGKVDMVKRASNDQTRVLASCVTGDYFGEMGVLDGSVRSTDAVTSEPTRLARIPKAAFVQTLHDAPGSTAMSFMHQVLDHLRVTNGRYVTEVVRKEKMTLVGEMANTIIHDIRGPFTSVQLGTDLIAEKHADQETLEICEMMKGQINRVKVMAEELLEFARGTSSIKLEEVELSELISQFHFLNRDFVASTNVKLKIEQEPVRVMADPNKLLRVLQNLMNNAIEALRNHPEALISITSTPLSAHVEIRIRDNGPGIPEPIRDRLFEPFVTHGKKNGTGLGMAITKSIIQAHQGKIYFETETGRGTDFIVELPKMK